MYPPPHTGYPLNALSDPCKKPLISLICSCPPLVQESIFRYCLDTLLTEVRTGLPTYGSRIILQLLINCKPSTCTECTQKVCKVRWILEHFISFLLTTDQATLAVQPEQSSGSSLSVVGRVTTPPATPCVCFGCMARTVPPPPVLYP